LVTLRRWLVPALGPGPVIFIRCLALPCGTGRAKRSAMGDATPQIAPAMVNAR
jgi:hypothetical protein